MPSTAGFKTSDVVHLRQAAVSNIEPTENHHHYRACRMKVRRPHAAQNSAF